MATAAEPRVRAGLRLVPEIGATVPMSAASSAPARKPVYGAKRSLFVERSRRSTSGALFMNHYRSIKDSRKEINRLMRIGKFNVAKFLSDKTSNSPPPAA